MTTAQALWSFGAAAGVVTITPGLDTALVLRTVAAHGARRGMLTGIGICLGVLSWGLLVAVGIGGVLQASRALYAAIRVVGAGYLLFLGGQFLLRKPERANLAVADRVGGGRFSSTGVWAPFVRGFLSNMLNPKVGVFYVSFLPLFVPRGVNVPTFCMLLAGIHALEGVAWFGILVLAARTISTWLQRPAVARSIDRLTGLVFVGFSLELLLGHDR